MRSIHAFTPRTLRTESSNPVKLSHASGTGSLTLCAFPVCIARAVQPERSLAPAESHRKGVAGGVAPLSRLYITGLKFSVHGARGGAALQHPGCLLSWTAGPTAFEVQVAGDNKEPACATSSAMGPGEESIASHPHPTALAGPWPQDRKKHLSRGAPQSAFRDHFAAQMMHRCGHSWPESGHRWPVLGRETARKSSGGASKAVSQQKNERWPDLGLYLTRNWP